MKSRLNTGAVLKKPKITPTKRADVIGCANTWVPLLIPIRIVTMAVANLNRRCLAEQEYETRHDEPHRPEDVGDRDDRARELPALLLETADELKRTDDQE